MTDLPPPSLPSEPSSLRPAASGPPAQPAASSRPAPAAPAHSGPGHSGPAQPGPGQPGPAHPGPGQPGPGRPGPAQPGPPQAPPARRRPLSAGRRVLFLTGLLLLALGLTELVVRALFEPPAAAFLAHPYVRHVRAPSQTTRLVSPLTGEAFDMVIDAHGFRSRSLEPPGTPKPADTYRVFFVGGSTTENIVLPDAETFPAIVEAELSPRVGKRLRCANAGISGNVVADTFSLVSHRVLTLEPDLVVALEGINDMCMGLSRRYDPTAVGYSAPPRVQFMDVLRARSRLVQLASRAVDRAESEWRPERMRERRRELPFTADLDPTRALPTFRRYLRLLAAVCREADVPLLLMTMPTLYKDDLSPEEAASLWMGCLDHGRLNVDHATMQRGMQAFNDAIREVAQAEGTLLLDLAPAVPRDLEHFYDDCHYTAKGSRAVADQLLYLLSRGLP